MSALVCGGFDLLHWGHIRFLKQAARFGPVTVALSSDRLLAATKRSPLVGYDDRRKALVELGCKVEVRDSQDATRIAGKVKPQFFVCGSDWLNSTHLEEMGFTTGFLNEKGIAVAYIPRNHEMSTSLIVEKIREGAV